MAENEPEGAWKVRYWRYGRQDVEPEGSLDWALAFCAAGVENGSHSAEAIVSPDGQVVDGNRFSDLTYAYEMSRLDEWLTDNWPEVAAQRQAAEAERMAKIHANKVAMTQGLAEFEAVTGVDLSRFDGGQAIVIGGRELRQIAAEIVDKALLA